MRTLTSLNGFKNISSDAHVSIIQGSNCVIAMIKSFFVDCNLYSRFDA